MKVQEFMTSDVTTCTADDSCREAVRLMAERDCGALPVVDEQGHALGVVTDRDIVLSAARQDAPLSKLSVSDAMSKGVFVCRLDDDVQRAEQLMCRHQVRRVPVVDEQDRVVGILSLADLARQASPRRTGDADPDRDVVAATLGAISQPSGEPRGPNGSPRSAESPRR